MEEEMEEKKRIVSDAESQAVAVKELSDDLADVKDGQSTHRGLSSEDVQQKIRLGQVNVSKIKAGKSYKKIVLDNLLTYFNLIYALVTLVLISFGSLSNLTYLVVIIPNVLIAIIQEWRAKAMVEKLSVTTDPRATVVRDGTETDINASEIVLGDLMRLEMGRQVLSDAIVTEGLCEANESMLTGESVPVRKQAGDRVLAGSFIVSGTAYAEVDRVGNDNYVTSLERSAKSFKAPSSNLFRDLNGIIKIIGWFIIPFSVVLFISNMFAYATDGVAFGSYEHIRLVVEKVCGSVVGMIPAGMYLLVTLALSLSVITLGRKRTLVQDMYSIEMLASADVVCLDKTGTITDGTMEVTCVIPLTGTSVSEIEGIMEYVNGEDDGINATSRALISRFGAKRGTLLYRVPFSSARKYSQAHIAEVGCYAVGAPHFVPCDISPDCEALIEKHAALGERVLVLSRSENTDSRGEALALIAIADRIRPSAAQTIANFQNNDVTVKVISGDHAATVSAIARRVGIKDAEKYISCENLSDEELCAAADEYAVFGRVTPEQKVLLVKALKDKGHTVAMTGDGVNDTLALKESNCAIAMAEGSEVARKVSQIVLLNSDFSTLPDVVKEGRRCINNVRQSASLFIMKTIFTILVTFFAIVTVSGYPFTPSKFAYLELFVIGIASFALALEPNEKRITGSFTEHVLTKSIPAALAMFIPTLAILIVSRTGGVERTVCDSVAMCAVILIGFINLIYVCRPFTKWRAFVAGLIGALLAIAIPIGVLADNTLFAASPMFNFGAALTDPVFFAVMMCSSFVFTLIMQTLRGPVEKLCSAVILRVEKKKKQS